MMPLTISNNQRETLLLQDIIYITEFKFWNFKKRKNNYFFLNQLFHESGTFKFLGLRVWQIKDGIIINQNLSVSSISPIDIKKGRSLRKKMINWAKRRQN